MLKMYNVTFVGDYFSITTTVYAHKKKQAIELANELLEYEYGWNVKSVSFDWTVEKVG